ncbi:MAG: preprotein translocase subunit SecG [Deltaproteobacteria bacterium]|nr:preprotein translocase subunit SecG [Deltaproteobacteria bacterium]
MINVLIIILHLIVCVALILIVLLQTGKGASMGAMFGGAGNQTLFGNTGASTFLSKATTVAAVVFMLTSLTLAYISTGGTGSVVEDYHPPASTELPIPGGDVAVPAQQPVSSAPSTVPQSAREAAQPAPVNTQSSVAAPAAQNQAAPPAEK